MNNGVWSPLNSESCLVHSVNNLIWQCLQGTKFEIKTIYKISVLLYKNRSNFIPLYMLQTRILSEYLKFYLKLDSLDYSQSAAYDNALFILTDKILHIANFYYC